MKKRVKLLTTIASLCLAVALMAFGVYAASNATLTLGSTVSFQNTNVAVSYKVTVEWTNNVKRTDAKNDVTENGTNGATVVDGYNAETPVAGSLVITGSHALQAAEGTADYTWKLGDYEFDASSVAVGNYVKYTVEITNDETNDIYVHLTSGVLAENVATKGVKVVVSGDFGEGASATAKKAVAAKDGETKTTVKYVVIYEVTDIAKDATDLPEFAPTFTATEYSDLA